MLVKIYTENPSEKEIDRVVNLLERDGVVIYPTDSVYAFGCSIRSAKAVERLRRKQIAYRKIQRYVPTHLPPLAGKA